MLNRFTFVKIRSVPHLIVKRGFVIRLFKYHWLLWQMLVFLVRLGQKTRNEVGEYQSK